MSGLHVVPAVVGGGLVGVGLLLALVASGKVVGVSGIVGGLLRPAPGDATWRLAFLVGLRAASPALCAPPATGLPALGLGLEGAVACFCLLAFFPLAAAGACLTGASSSSSSLSSSLSMQSSS